MSQVFPARQAPEIQTQHCGITFFMHSVVTGIQQLHGVLLCGIEFEALMVYGVLIGS